MLRLTTQEHGRQGSRKLLTSTQVRERLGIGESKLSELIRTGQIKAVKLGAARNAPYRISEEALAEFIERNTVKPTEAAS